MSDRNKRLIATLCAIVIVFGVCAGLFVSIQAATGAGTTVLNLEEDVKYFGRTYAENGVRYFSWSNSGFQFSFYGTGATASLRVSQHTAGSSTQTAYVKVYVDGILSKDIALAEAETDVTLASGLTEGLHTVKVIKRTSAYYTAVGLSEIQLDAGSEIRETRKYYERKMLVIGDDLSTGYGSMVTNANVAAGSVPGYTTATEDSTITYASLTSDYFGAENMTVALSGGSGRGIVKNGGGSTTHIAPRFFEYLDYRNKRDVVYDHSQFDPDVVVINLGTYDNTAGVTATAFRQGCKNFILQVRAAYPEAKILYAYGFHSNPYANSIQSVVSELNNAGDTEVYYTALTGLAASEKGISGHPTKEAHVSRSKELIAAVEKITGWTGADTDGNPVTTGADTSYEPMEPTDITTMSYNVLAHNSSSQTYENYTTRMAKVVKLIQAYAPDVLGLQEVARVSTSWSHDWPGYLADNLSEYGYVRLDQQANNADLMLIGNGLMIMYKKDRFTLLSSGYKQFTSTATVSGVTDTDASRWFHWVQLQDNKTGSVFYFYNTHLSIDPTNASYTSAQKTAFGEIHRTNQCQTLANHIATTTKATKCPFFLVGDFNTSYETANKYVGVDATKESFYKLINYTKGTTVYDFFRDAVLTADYSRFVNYTDTLDHIFVNSRYVEVKEVHSAAEGVDGRRTSDHSPLIAHCNFKANAQISGIDTSSRLFEASTAANSYTFDISAGTGVTYDVYDGGKLVGSGSAGTSVTVALDNRVNRFGVVFKDGYGNHTCTIEAVITCTAVNVPSIKATGSVVNSYFANNAFHVLVNGDTLNLATSSGSLYTNPFASRGADHTITLTSVPAGRSVYFVMTATKDVYPIYVYKETTQASADSSVLYVDDDIGDATGTVAFCDGSRVLFATKGQNAFTTVEEVAKKANEADGFTVYFAPGQYSVNNTADDVVFTKDVTLLGNNHDVSPIDVQGAVWSLAGRKPETIIDGSLVFSRAGNLSVTVKGFTITGTSVNGPIYITDPTSDGATIVKHTQTLNIQSNIITGGGNGEGTAPAAVHAYSGAMVTGSIKDNYFRCTINRHDNPYTRASYIKNCNSLTLESNYFIGYESTNVFTDEISNTVAGYCKYTVLSNRFEHCVSSRTYVKGITADTGAAIVYNLNEFIRCGGQGADSGYAIDINFTENSLHNDFSNITVSILRNKYYDCYRSLRVQRAANTSQTGNMAQMKFKIKQNSFINPLEGKWSKYFHSIRFSFLVDTTYTHNVSIPDTQWDFAGNTFKSTFLDQEALSGENTTTPAFNYVYNTVSYGGTSGNCFNLTAAHFS